jgi:uncharacterized protein YjbI with pentapeptide repeats
MTVNPLKPLLPVVKDPKTGHWSVKQDHALQQTQAFVQVPDIKLPTMEQVRNVAKDPITGTAGMAIGLISLFTGLKGHVPIVRRMRVRIPEWINKNHRQEVGNEFKTRLNNPHATPQDVKQALEFMHHHNLPLGEVHAPPDMDSYRRAHQSEQDLDIEALRNPANAARMNGEPFTSLLRGRNIPNLNLSPRGKRNPDFAYRILSGLRVPRSTLVKTDWTQSRARNLVVDESHLPGNNFTDTEVTNMSARDTTFPGSRFVRTTGLTYTYPNEWAKKQAGIHLEGASPVQKLLLFRKDLSDKVLDKSRWVNVLAALNRFNQASIKKGFIDPATVTLGSDMTGLQAQRVKAPQRDFGGSELAGSDWSGGDLPGADYRGYDLSKRYAALKNLLPVRLSGSARHRTNLQNALMMGQDLNGQNLSHTNIEGIQFKAGQGPVTTPLRLNTRRDRQILLSPAERGMLEPTGNGRPAPLLPGMLKNPDFKPLPVPALSAKTIRALEDCLMDKTNPTRRKVLQLARMYKRQETTERIPFILQSPPVRKSLVQDALIMDGLYRQYWQESVAKILQKRDQIQTDKRIRHSQNANLNGLIANHAKAQGVDVSGLDARHSSWVGSDMQGMNLTNTLTLGMNVDKADLRGAIGLTVQQLMQMKGVKNAKLDNHLYQAWLTQNGDSV